MDRRVSAAAAVAGLLVFGAMAYPQVRGEAIGFDLPVRAAIHGWAFPALTAAMRLITTLGSEYFLLPLAALAGGARAKVREIDDEDAARLARWREIGLVPGAVVHVREVRPLDGVVELEVAGRVHVTSVASIEGIRVQRARGTAGGS